MTTKRTGPHCLSLLSLLAAVLLAVCVKAGEPSPDQFADPPMEARPSAYWDWLNGNVDLSTGSGCPTGIAVFRGTSPACRFAARSSSDMAANLRGSAFIPYQPSRSRPLKSAVYPVGG